MEQSHSPPWLGTTDLQHHMIMGLGRVIQFAFVIPSCTLKIVSDFRSVISYTFLIRLCNIDDAQPKMFTSIHTALLQE